MKFEVKLAPPNSIVLVMNFKSGHPPSTFSGNLVSATPTCVAIGTLSEQDGDTTITLTDEHLSQTTSIEYLVFDGLIDVQGMELSLVSAHNEQLLSLPVQGGLIRIRVWANDKSEPDHIWVVVG